MSPRTFEVKETISVVGDGVASSYTRDYMGSKTLPPNAIVQVAEAEVAEAPDGDAMSFALEVHGGPPLDFNTDPGVAQGTQAVAPWSTYTGPGAPWLVVRLLKAGGSVPSAPTVGAISVRVRGVIL